MAGIGTIVNVIAVIIGSFIGINAKKAIPEKLRVTLVQALALATAGLGISGMTAACCSVAESGELNTRYTLVMVVSMALGTLIGELADIDKMLNNTAEKLKNKLNSGDGFFTEGFVTASMIFCVGSMSILGALNDGISHDPAILITKSILDGIMSVILSSTLGIGVMFAALTVGVYQGIITICSSFMAPLLTDALISQMSFIGNIIIIGIGLNLIYKQKLNLVNMLPAMFMPALWYAAGHFAGRFF